jgi:lauroyl/myristoyl acyltransferase
MAALARWIWTNGWQLYAKVTAGLAKSARTPKTKKKILNRAGALTGYAAYPLQAGKRKKTREYLRVVSGENPGVTVMDCFTQAGRDFVWDIVSFDSPGLIAELIDISDWLLMKNHLDEKRGAVMIGAHYGPSFNVQTYSHAGSGLNATVLLSADAAESKKNKTAKALRFLRTRPDAEDPEPKRMALAGRQERILVEKIRAGGSVYVNSDIPRKDGGVEVEIAGQKVRLSAFAFKLAAKYKSPAYFCGSVPDESGGYRWIAEEQPYFADPEEGVRAYANWLNARIKENPALWHGLRFFK